jgi:hypothetical protein
VPFLNSIILINSQDLIHEICENIYFKNLVRTIQCSIYGRYRWGRSRRSVQYNALSMADIGGDRPDGPYNTMLYLWQISVGTVQTVQADHILPFKLKMLFQRSSGTQGVGQVCNHTPLFPPSNYPGSAFKTRSSRLSLH